MPLRPHDRDSRVIHPQHGPLSDLTARAGATASDSSTTAFQSTLALPGSVDFSSIVQGELGGITTSPSPPSTSSGAQSTLLNASQSTSSSTSTAESKGLPVGVIVGASIGGLAIILMIIILLVSVQRGNARMRNAMGRTVTPMTNLKDRPPPRLRRSTEIVPFEDERSANNHQSSHSSSVHSSKPPQLEVDNAGHQHVGVALPNINNTRNRATEHSLFMAEDNPPSYQTASGLS